MAPASTSHQFQKLKLDTVAPPKPVVSSFASLTRNGAHRNPSASPLNGAADGGRHLYTPNPRDHRSDSGPGAPFDEAALAAALGGGRDHHDAHDDGDDDGHHLHDSHLVLKSRKRTPSVSFGDMVTLDSGSQLSLGAPLPRFETVPGCHPYDGSDEGDWSDQDMVMISIDRKDRRRHRVGEPRYPLLQATVNELAEEEPQVHGHDHDNDDQVASLTSQTSASPAVEELHTPPEAPGQYMLSPIQVSSPIEFSSSCSQRNVPRRTRSYREQIDGDGTTGRRSRKSSVRSPRSAQSSMSSTARSFLDMYKSSRSIKAPEPDDEGQGIGYHGEYIIGKQIGYGGFSVVKEVTSLENGKSVVHAVKIVRKHINNRSEFENDQLQTQFDHEVEIWRFLRHPYILPLLRVYNTNFATYCITQLNKGGTLFDLVRETRRKKKSGLDAHLAKRYTYQLASALRYLHNDVLIVHRDVKLENCLVDMTSPGAEEEGGNVLLCDFGMADFIVSDQRDGPEPFSMGVNQNIGPAETSTCVAGSLLYAAPELFDAPGPVFSPAADIWAFGVVIYCLLTAHYPFKESLDSQTTARIQSGDWDESLIYSADAVQQGGLVDALALVRGCLEMRPEQRWTINDIIACPWLKGCAEKYESVDRPWVADS